MEKVKIKRVKRNKKKITTGEKLMAGVGVGAALFGAGGAVKAVQSQTRTSAVSNLGNSSGQKSATQKIKQTIAQIFGVQTAEADTLPTIQFNGQTYTQSATGSGVYINTDINSPSHFIVQNPSGSPQYLGLPQLMSGTYSVPTSNDSIVFKNPSGGYIDQNGNPVNKDGSPIQSVASEGVGASQGSEANGDNAGADNQGSGSNDSSGPVSIIGDGTENNNFYVRFDVGGQDYTMDAQGNLKDSSGNQASQEVVSQVNGFIQSDTDPDDADDLDQLPSFDSIQSANQGAESDQEDNASEDEGPVSIGDSNYEKGNLTSMDFKVDGDTYTMDAQGKITDSNGAPASQEIVSQITDFISTDKNPDDADNLNKLPDTVSIQSANSNAAEASEPAQAGSAASDADTSSWAEVIPGVYVDKTTNIVYAGSDGNFTPVDENSSNYSVNNSAGSEVTSSVSYDVEPVETSQDAPVGASNGNSLNQASSGTSLDSDIDTEYSSNNNNFAPVASTPLETSAPADSDSSDESNTGQEETSVDTTVTAPITTTSSVNTDNNSTDSVTVQTDNPTNSSWDGIDTAVTDPAQNQSNTNSSATQTSTPAQVNQTSTQAPVVLTSSANTDSTTQTSPAATTPSATTDEPSSSPVTAPDDSASVPLSNVPDGSTQNADGTYNAPSDASGSQNVFDANGNYIGYNQNGTFVPDNPVQQTLGNTVTDTQALIDTSSSDTQGINAVTSDLTTDQVAANQDSDNATYENDYGNGAGNGSPSSGDVANSGQGSNNGANVASGGYVGGSGSEVEFVAEAVDD